MTARGCSAALGRGVLGTASLAAALPAAYLGTLTIASLKPHRCGTDRSVRFAVVVPAHDEATNISPTISSLRAIDYPGDQFRIVVIADNCSDATADIARHAGAEVLERTAPDDRGKGAALAWAFDRLLRDDTSIDAVVVIDADTVVDADLLSHAAFHVQRGDQAIQVDYRVRNPDESWRTLLLDVAFTAQHRIRSGGRATLGLSSGLRGNGMVFTRQLLEAVPYSARSVVEDIEFGITLGERGIAVAACDATSVAGDMPTGADHSGSQRTRWEAGRTRMRRDHLGPVTRRAVSERDPMLADLAADLAVPPIATITTALGAAAALSLVTRPGSLARRGASIGITSLVLHVAVALSRSTDPRRAALAIGRVPVYLVWKLVLRASSGWREQQAADATWTRTVRSDTALVDLQGVPA